MIISMTGYGKAIAGNGKKSVTVEIRSLNSKQIDISVKAPWQYREKEPEIRSMIGRSLERGKIDISVNCETVDDDLTATINKSLVINYYKQLKDICSEIGVEAGESLLPVAMRLPETVKQEKESLSEEEWIILKEVIIQALEELNIYRRNEGEALEADLKKSLNSILALLGKIEPLEETRTKRIRERLMTNFGEYGKDLKIDQNRFEQEIIYYLEKNDINEEKVRLKKHCEYFTETLEGEISGGKTMSFIVQEMGREINTLGAKANDAEIQRVVVMMKEELEKIKEQLFNVL